MKRIIAISFLIVGLHIEGYAFKNIFLFKNSNQLKTEPTVIKGYMQDGIEDSEITVRVFSYFFSSRYNLDAVTYRVKPEHGVFKIVLPSVKRNCYLSVIFSFFPNWKYNLNLYLLEPGDSINIYYTSKGVEFGGKGCEKFQAQHKISHLPGLHWSRDELVTFDGKHGYSFLQAVFDKYNDLENKKLNLLRSYREEIGLQFYERLKMDYQAEKLLQLFNGYYFWMKYRATSKERAEQIQFYRDHLAHQDINLGNEDYEFLSKFYTDFLFQKVIIGLSLREKGEIRKPTLEEVYQYITHNFKGIIEEKLLTTCFIQMYTSGSGQEQYLQRTIGGCSDLYLQSILRGIYDSKSNGKAAFNFSLENEKGDFVKLTDFSGKVIVIDFWFSGCVACRALEKEMKPLRAYFSNNRNLIFLSVNTDSDRAKWKKSLSNENYSGKDEMNLNTGKLGTGHPLIKYYGFIDFPQLIVIDKKLKLVSASLIHPVNDSCRTLFIGLIKKELGRSLDKKK